MKKKADHVAIGKITRTHGIKGELRLLPFFADTTFMYNLDEIKIVLKDGSFTDNQVERFRVHTKYFLIKLVDFDDINNVGKFIGGEVYVHESIIPPLENDEFYAEELVGCSIQSETGKHIGELEEVIFSPCHDVYQIKTTEGKELLVPAISEFVKNIDVDKKIITIIEPEYA